MGLQYMFVTALHAVCRNTSCAVDCRFSLTVQCCAVQYMQCIQCVQCIQCIQCIQCMCCAVQCAEATAAARCVTLHTLWWLCGAVHVVQCSVLQLRLRHGAALCTFCVGSVHTVQLTWRCALGAVHTV